MFDPLFESLRKATESSIQMQQEMFRKWVGLWPGMAPGMAAMPYKPEQFQEFQKRWAETVNELIKQRRESTEAMFKAGLENIEKTFQLGEVKNVEELREKSITLWKQYFDSLRQAYEIQVRDFQTAMTRWGDLMMTKGAA